MASITRQHAARATRRPNDREQFSDADREQARTDIKRAFELCGLGDGNGHPICPLCGKSGKNRIKFFPDGGFKCFSASNCSGPRKAGGKRGDAIDLVMERLGVTFPEAVGLLLGRPISASSKNAKPLPPPVVIEAEADGFKAIVDSEVYQMIADAGDARAVTEYFARFHITEQAVRDIGFFMVLDCRKLHRDLMERFGRERLISCGVLIEGRDGRDDFFVISDRYPVGEPHRHPDGRILGLQFRPSYDQERRYKAHREYAVAKKAAEAAGQEFREPKANERYVPKFMSLKGGTGDEHLVGGNLPRCGTLANGSTIYVVEGLKDAAAILSRGFEAYALPGAGTVPPKEVVRLLARHNLVLAFDGDQGGDDGTANLMRSLARHGILTDETIEGFDGSDLSQLLGDDAHPWAERTLLWRSERSLGCRRKRPPAGMDVADALAQHVADASATCRCPACGAHRSRA